jgi:3,4-dihydroxy 2-butanone 4-phosphate synthase/GTP cyclohydrolase II|eukprot:g9233.t1
MKYTHELRALNQGILIGVNTVLADNPSLTVRLCPGDNPKPVILDSNLRTPTTCKLLVNKQCVRPIILYSCQDSATLNKVEALTKLGCVCVKCKSSDGHVDLDDALKQIKQEPHNINTLMVEGGGQVITSFVRLHWSPKNQFSIYKVIITIAPTFVGGVKSIATLLPFCRGAESESGECNFPRLLNKEIVLKGNDIIVEGILDSPMQK